MVEKLSQERGVIIYEDNKPFVARAIQASVLRSIDDSSGLPEKWWEPPNNIKVDRDSAWKVWQVAITMDEGKKHIVRKLTKAVGLHPLLSLHRDSFGPLSLSLRARDEVGDCQDLKSACMFKFLDVDTVHALWECAGGLTQVIRTRMQAVLRGIVSMESQGMCVRHLQRWLQSEACLILNSVIEKLEGSSTVTSAHHSDASY
jgi:hypothetical protein